MQNPDTTPMPPPMMDPRAIKRDEARKRMLRGGLFALLGCIVTVGTLMLASDGGIGGRYVICYGAIILGVIDFFIGLFGWLSNQ